MESLCGPRSSCPTRASVLWRLLREASHPWPERTPHSSLLMCQQRPMFSTYMKSRSSNRGASASAWRRTRRHSPLSQSTGPPSRARASSSFPFFDGRWPLPITRFIIVTSRHLVKDSGLRKGQTFPHPDWGRGEEGVEACLGTGIMDRYTRPDKPLQGPLLVRIVDAESAALTLGPGLNAYRKRIIRWSFLQDQIVENVLVPSYPRKQRRDASLREGFRSPLERITNSPDVRNVDPLVARPPIGKSILDGMAEFLLEQVNDFQERYGLFRSTAHVEDGRREMRLHLHATEVQVHEVVNVEHIPDLFAVSVDSNESPQNRADSEPRHPALVLHPHLPRAIDTGLAKDDRLQPVDPAIVEHILVGSSRGHP